MLPVTTTIATPVGRASASCASNAAASLWRDGAEYAPRNLRVLHHGTTPDALLEFAACMRDHGVDMIATQPASVGGAIVIRAGEGGDRKSASPLDDSDAFAAAEDACRGLLQALDAPDPDPARDGEVMERLLVHSACMRDHGIPMNDPVVQGGDFKITARVDGELVDSFSEDFQAAREARREFDPLAGGGLWTGG